MGHTFNQMVCCHRAVPDKKLISGSDVWHVLRKQLCHLISFWAWVLLLMQQESWNELLVVLSDRFCTHWQSLVLTCTLICEDKTAWPLGCCHFQHSSDRSWKIGLWKKKPPLFQVPWLKANSGYSTVKDGDSQMFGTPEFTVFFFNWWEISWVGALPTKKTHWSWFNHGILTLLVDSVLMKQLQRHTK